MTSRKKMTRWFGPVYFSYSIWKCYVVAFPSDCLLLDCVLSVVMVVFGVQMTDWIGKINTKNWIGSCVKAPERGVSTFMSASTENCVIWALSDCSWRGYPLVGLPSAIRCSGVSPSLTSSIRCSMLKGHEMS